MERVADQAMSDAETPPEMLDLSLPPSSCESARRPLVMMHGFLAAGDTWSRHTQRLIATGSCPEWVRAYDWNTLDMAGDHTLELEVLIDQLIADSGFESVDLIGHSAGGGLGYQFLNDLERAQKVHRYVHIASFANEAPPTPAEGVVVPTLNLWSRSDLTVESEDIPGATNVMLEEEDHYAVATSLKSYQAITAFLYDEVTMESEINEDPRPLEVTSGEVSMSGRVLTLGENAPLTETPLSIWSRAPSGERLEEVASLVTDAEGRFSITGLSASVSYELAPENTQESPSVQYFTPPLTRDDPLIYLRTFPGPGTLASVLVGQLPTSEETVSIVFFNAHRAFLAGRDSLTLDGRELISPEVAAAENTTIALFVFDVNTDGEDGGTLPLFDSFPFLAVSDVPLAPSPLRSLEINYNGLTLTLPARPASEGTMIVVFP